jgi:hypothetical protein
LIERDVAAAKSIIVNSSSAVGGGGATDVVEEVVVDDVDAEEDVEVEAPAAVVCGGAVIAIALSVVVCSDVVTAALDSGAVVNPAVTGTDTVVALPVLSVHAAAVLVVGVVGESESNHVAVVPLLPSDVELVVVALKSLTVLPLPLRLETFTNVVDSVSSGAVVVSSAANTTVAKTAQSRRIATNGGRMLTRNSCVNEGWL